MEVLQGNPFAWVDERIAGLSNAIAMPQDQIGLVMWLVLNLVLSFAFPFVLALRRSPSASSNEKGKTSGQGKEKEAAPYSSSNTSPRTSSTRIVLGHLLAIAPALLSSVHLLGWGTAQNLLSSLFVWIVLRLFHRKQWCHQFVTVFALLFMAYSHLYSMWWSYYDWRLDFTRPQMLITVKMMTLACNIYDANLRKQEDLSKYQKEKQVKEVPSLLEYLGYIYYFPSFWVGPPIHFSEYKRYIEGTLFEEFGGLPTTFIPACRRLAGSLACVALHVVLLGVFPLKFVCTPEFQHDWNPIARMLYILGVTFATRLGFYFAWLLAESGVIASGLGFNGIQFNPKNGKKENRWNRAVSIDVLRYELAQTPRDLVASWNQGVQQWLYHYIYLRSFRTVKVKDATTGETKVIQKRMWYSTMLTNLLSAFWHGFYPGYYLSFGSLALVVEAARILRGLLRHHFIKKTVNKAKEAKDSSVNGMDEKEDATVLYNFASWVATVVASSYAMLPIVLLEATCTWCVWKSLAFAGHLIFFAVLLLPFVLPKSRANGKHLHKD